MFRRSWVQAVTGLLEFVYPERCVLCEASPADVAWWPGACAGPGCRAADRPHLCAACAAALAPQVVRGAVTWRAAGGPVRAVPLWAGRVTDATLVRVLGAWKYHGVRGLAAPLGDLAAAAVGAAVREVPPVAGLVPLPLHSRRRRERGFNQAEILARRGGGPPVASGLLRRIRSTAQQARRPDAAARLANVAGAFRAVRGPDPGEDPRLGLIDDLVTGGATVAAGAEALEAAGWRVAWIAAAGAAAGVLDAPAPRVDTAGAAT